MSEAVQETRQEKRISKRLSWQVAFCDLQGIATICQAWADKEVQLLLVYPSSPSQGGFAIRPYSRGGPGVLIDVSSPESEELALEACVTAIRQHFA